MKELRQRESCLSNMGIAVLKALRLTSVPAALRYCCGVSQGREVGWAFSKMSSFEQIKMSQQWRLPEFGG